MNKNKQAWLPFLISLAIVGFISLGLCLEHARSRYLAPAGSPQTDSHTSLFSPFSGMTDYASPDAKMQAVLQLLQSHYVDTLDMNQVVEDALPVLISELDPHSVYIPASDLAATNEQLDGSFSGIGVQFNIQNDTVMVISVISGGPSERVGLMPGDRIVTIDDSTFVGKGINNEKVFKNLRGEKGTHVKVGIRRASADEILHFDIVRGDIPVNSVMASYIVAPGIGYINIDNFGRNTYDEFYTALSLLKVRGAKGYIIDLRGNSGGYMEVCARMVNEFLDRGDLIVYTEGNDMPRSYLRADGRGAFKEAPVVVLIDEWSASASEILAGAIQDNDRGTVIGRRSFGKGLVQQQFELADGSALRLTVARYYTPSGRCIQKAYKMGDSEEYALDLIHRYERGEFYSRDSIHLVDSLKYTTRRGRTVYGGGGIMPDIFVPSDTTGITPYYNKVINAGLLYSYAFRYADSHREQLSAYSDFEQMERHLLSLDLIPGFVTFASDKVKPDRQQIATSHRPMERLLIAYIMRQVKDDNYFYREFYVDDPIYRESIRILQEGKAFPEP